MLNGTVDLKTGRLSGWPDLIARTFKLAKSSLVGYRFETQGFVIFFSGSKIVHVARKNGQPPRATTNKETGTSEMNYL